MSDIVTTDNRKPPIVVLRERLEARSNELKNALTDVSPEQFIRALITSAQVNPDLQACSFQSIWLACMRACRDNLLPDGREGAIVPYKSTAQWIPMYQGLLKRFRQSGECKWIGADVVREGEVFEHWIDQGGEHFKHVPDGDEKAAIVKVYAAALTKDGAFYVAVMSISEINKIKAMSKASRDDSPWKVWPGEMMKKTALRRLSKLLPAGRDFFEEDDDEVLVNKLPEPPAVQIVGRASGGVGALNAFVGNAPESIPDELAAKVDEVTGGGEVERTADRSLGDDPISIAYARGKVANRTGMHRKAMPGEYREEANKAEADAWLAGFDGKEIPDGQATG